MDTVDGARDDSLEGAGNPSVEITTIPAVRTNPSGCVFELEHESSRPVGPSLLLVYHSVAKKKLSKLVVRNHNGNAYNDSVCTNFGVAVSPLVQVGSFANQGDKDIASRLTVMITQTFTT
jgi:hypothetical protein